MPERPAGGAPTGLAAVLFDMDGTLVDREPLMTAAAAEVMAAVGMALHEDEVASWVGRSWHDVHAELGVADAVGWSLERWHGEIVQVADRMVASGAEVRELAGAALLIGELHDVGVPVAVVTGSTRPEVGPVLDAMGVTDRVRLVVASGDYERGKPDPQPYLVAASRLDVPPAGCVVIEDSEVGVLAGLAAGMAVVGTVEANPPPGHPAHQRLDRAHRVIGSLAELSVDDLRSLVVAVGAKGGDEGGVGQGAAGAVDAGGGTGAGSGSAAG